MARSSRTFFYLMRSLLPQAANVAGGNRKRIAGRRIPKVQKLKERGKPKSKKQCGYSKKAFVIVCPKYIKYGDIYYTKCSLTFSSKFINMAGTPLREHEKVYYYRWPTSRVVKIEYHWYERVKAHVVNLQLAINDSGIKALEFAVIDDPRWSKIEEEIKSLNVKYEAVWETIMSKCSSKEDFDGITYPEGDSDSVFISENDVQKLQPEAYINDTIIDFYIKYLANGIKPEEQKMFHFFNTFFFRKLACTDKGLAEIRTGRQAFQRVLNWTKRIDIFNKDFLFIPVNLRLHWSLIVICYPVELTNLVEKGRCDASRRPCILHMDSIRGSHRKLRSIIRSYLWEEWKQRHDHQDATIRARFLKLPFDMLKLPQQENLFDCGLFLLHYVELFLAMSANFNSTKYSNILNKDWFLPAEVSIKKRDIIRKLIYKLVKEKASKDPQVASRDNNPSSVVNGDSCAEELDKATFLGVRANHQIKGRRSFSDMLEPENIVKSSNDESILQHLTNKRFNKMRQPLKIPKSWTRALPENVSLKDRYNNIWLVKAQKVGTQWYFEDGWAKFVDENHIEKGDLLIFKYSCYGLFNFSLFGEHYCEKTGVGYCKHNHTNEGKLQGGVDKDRTNHEELSYEESAHKQYDKKSNENTFAEDSFSVYLGKRKAVKQIFDTEAGTRSNRHTKKRNACNDNHHLNVGDDILREIDEATSYREVKRQRLLSDLYEQEDTANFRKDESLLQCKTNEGKQRHDSYCQKRTPLCCRRNQGLEMQIVEDAERWKELKRGR